VSNLGPAQTRQVQTRVLAACAALEYSEVRDFHALAVKTLRVSQSSQEILREGP
jgi:hypothetical protein